MRYYRLGKSDPNSSWHTFVQASSSTPQTTVAVALSQSQIVGNLMVVIVGWNDTPQPVSSVAFCRAL
jgi:hypothetical protein